MKKLFILLTVLLVVGSACKKGFLNVDEVNPNNASAVPANLILPAALNNTSILMNTPGNYAFVYEWHGLWSISGGYSQDLNMTQYNLLNSHFQGDWNSAYTNLENYDYIEKASTSSSQKAYRAIAKIMKAYIFQTLVDTYGNIPYSEALKADKGILKPEYDPQQTVYEDLVVQLDTAMNIISTITPDDENPGAKDIIYSGDMGAWAKLANTIKLRILINQDGMSGRDSYITSNLATTSSVGYIGAGEGAWLNPGYLQSAGKMNPFWERFYKQDNSQQADGLGYFVAGQDACDFLTANNDPRKLRYFQAYSGTNVQGNYFGANVLQTVPNTSKIGPGMLQNFNQNAPILTDIESLFLQAEAAQKGYIAGNAKDFYNDGVTASILYEGQKAWNDPASYTPLSTADANTYLSQAKANVSFDASADKIKAIITQKWIGLNGLSPMPVWTDFRRTGFPDFLHFTADPFRKNDTPPVRLLYPQTEINTNNANVLAQGTIDLFSSKIFWQNR